MEPKRCICSQHSQEKAEPYKTSENPVKTHLRRAEAALLCKGFVQSSSSESHEARLLHILGFAAP